MIETIANVVIMVADLVLIAINFSELLSRLRIRKGTAGLFHCVLPEEGRGYLQDLRHHLPGVGDLIMNAIEWLAMRLIKQIPDAVITGIDGDERPIDLATVMESCCPICPYGYGRINSFIAAAP